MSSSHDHGHDVRTEKRDVDPGSVRKAGVWLVAVTIGAMLVLLPLMVMLEDLGSSREPEARPLAFEEARQPPVPRLQTHPTRALEALRAEEDAILSSYAWVDEDEQIVRLPIKRAMELVALRGLPAPTPLPQPAEGGTP